MTDQGVRATDVLKPEWFPEYEKQRNAIHIQLLNLNTMQFILEKIEMFPFWLFTPNINDYLFWRTTRITYIETTLMIASRIIVEADKDALTLKGYKSEIIRNAIDDRAKKTITDRLRAVDFDRRIDQIEEKLRRIRNNYLAHHNKLENTLSPDQRTTPDLTYAEMKTLLAAGWELFDALSFDASFSRGFMEYGSHISDREQTDIDRLLEHVATSSYLLNLPERNKEAWEIRRAKLIPEEIEHINRYRAKAGLTPVS